MVEKQKVRIRAKTYNACLQKGDQEKGSKKGEKQGRKDLKKGRKQKRNPEKGSLSTLSYAGK